MTTLLHELLVNAAALAADQVAVETADESVSYARLDHLSDRLAARLLHCRLPKGSRVGLLVRKSMHAYVGLYGILKAGCAYVPLDRQAPLERLAYIIDNCQISVLVVTAQATRQLDQLLESSPGIRYVILLDGEPDFDAAGATVFGAAETFATEPCAGPHIVDTDLAYILYTSGSTGRPKGVMISHAVSMSFVGWALGCAGLTEHDRVSGHAPLHFDLSIFDIFATARARATLLPVADGASTFPTVLTDWMVRNRITVWYSVPSILTMMAKQRTFQSHTFDSLRLVLFAGEVFPVKYLKIWLQIARQTAFMNWYGPTETNVVTSYVVRESPAELETPVPIGKPTSNADLYCIGENGEVVTATGETGELYARGPCVALGYWGDEARTNERFLGNPLQPWLRDRVYRTGDLVHRDENGNYVYQGRIDHQIKCRGYRIEIGEIETALFRIDSVQEAAVIPVPDEEIGNRLVAYVALGAAGRQTSNDILSCIGGFLPKYMLPETVRIEEYLPKTSNGKVDRQELLTRAMTQLTE